MVGKNKLDTAIKKVLKENKDINLESPIAIEHLTEELSKEINQVIFDHWLDYDN